MPKLLSNMLKIIIPLLLIIVLLLGYLYYPLLTFNGKSFIAHAEETSTQVKDNGQPLANYANGYNFEKLQNELYKESTVVITDYNPIKPVITFVQDAKSEQRQDINIYHLQRNIQNQNNYDIISFQTAKSFKYSFNDILTIVKQTDLTKTNPNKDDIVVFPVPTKEEVQRQKDSSLLNQQTHSKADLDFQTYKDNLVKLSKNELGDNEKKSLCTLLQKYYKQNRTDLLRETSKPMPEPLHTQELNSINDQFNEITPLLNNQCKAIGIGL